MSVYPLLVEPTPVGPTVTGADIEEAVLDCLREWLPAYVCEVERQHDADPGSTPQIRGWAVTGRDFAKLTSDQLPCLVLLSSGIVNPPRKESGHGVYTATWGLGLVIAFNAAWGRDARRRAQWCIRAAQLALEQRPIVVLDQTLIVDWQAEGYDEMDFESSRSYSASSGSFNVSCRETAWANGGPPPPAVAPTDPTVPFEPWVQVVSTEQTVENYPPPADLPAA